MAENKSSQSSDQKQESSQSNKGFASMDPEKQREIASQGGKAAHEKGTAHEWDSKEASEAGKTAHEKGTAHEWDSKEASEAGKKGGAHSHGGGRDQS
jgi:general stress protein YciG